VAGTAIAETAAGAAIGSMVAGGGTVAAGIIGSIVGAIGGLAIGTRRSALQERIT